MWTRIVNRFRRWALRRRLVALAVEQGQQQIARKSQLNWWPRLAPLTPRERRRVRRRLGIEVPPPRWESVS